MLPQKVSKGLYPVKIYGLNCRWGGISRKCRRFFLFFRLSLSFERFFAVPSWCLYIWWSSSTRSYVKDPSSETRMLVPPASRDWLCCCLTTNALFDISEKKTRLYVLIKTGFEFWWGNGGLLTRVVLVSPNKISTRHRAVWDCCSLIWNAGTPKRNQHVPSKH